MELFYRYALLDAGYTEDSKMYKEIERMTDAGKKQVKRGRAKREEMEIDLILTSTLGSREDEKEDIPSEEDLEEKIIHKIELEDLMKCFALLTPEEQDLLRKYSEGEYGIVKKLSSEMGIPYNDLYYRINKIKQKMKKLMADRGYT